MHSISVGEATVVDLLDRVLERGVVINADIIICLAGVPLIGVNLRAALAGMETMVRYGMMQEWDERVRTGEFPPSLRRMIEPPVAAAPANGN